ncbi:hypothetical protein C0989_007142, partial [Termitomyces sp. Mn162]
MASGSKRYLYEQVRTPSGNKVSDDDVLPIWCAHPKEKNSSIDTGKKAKAPKANAIFKYLRSAILDPEQTYLRAVLNKMIENYDHHNEVMKSMLSSLQSTPPALTLFKFGRDDDSMGFTDMRIKERIFICDKLSSALEMSEAHWMHHDSKSRKVSGRDQQWKDFWGKNVTDSMEKKREGEAGYFVEGMMWGGIITFALPFRPFGKRDTVPGLYQRQATSLESTRPWGDIALVLLQKGNFADLGRENISVEAMAKRLTPGTIIKTFAADELVPLYVLKKDGRKIAWSFEDPTATE